MCTLTWFLAFALTVASAQTTGGLPRFPDIGHGAVVFTAGGDLWKVSDKGGTATRLTTHRGDERFARISPDGKWIAYTAEYEGDSDVWVIPFDGGNPKRLTWHSVGYMDDVVWDWTADSQKVVFGSRHGSIDGRYQSLYTVDLLGHLPEPLPTSDAGPTALLPEEGSYVHNRVFRNFRTWKRYRGGSQQDLWKFDAATGKGTQLTTFAGTDTHPMVDAEGSIFFVSDRPDTDGAFSTRNLFRYTDVGEAAQLTTHADFDVQWPSLDGDTIVYMHGGELRTLNAKTKADAVLSITIPDEALQTNSRLIKVGRPTWQSVGPQAKRVAGVANGNLFTVPAEDGSWRSVVSGSQGRITEAAWSPEGEQIAYISDVSGEQEIWLVDQDGKSEPKQLTKGNDTWLNGLVWSPDGERLLVGDKRMRLWDVSVPSGERKLVDTGERSDLYHPSYSHDGGWIAYVRADVNWHGAVWVYNVFSGEKFRVTDDFNDDYNPTWDPEGDFLFFASRRSFDLISNVFEFRLVHRMTDLLFAVRLKEDGPHPVPTKSDEEVDDDGLPLFDMDEEDEKDEKKKKKKKRKKDKKIVLPTPDLKIDLDGIGDRVTRLPMQPGRYYNLVAIEGALLYISAEGLDGGDSNLMHYDLEDQELEFVSHDVVSFEVAADGEMLLAWPDGGGSYVMDAAPDSGPGTFISFWGMTSRVDPRVEWKRTLDEVRRYMRDYFYDPDMHGHDWDALHKRYEGLLARATTESDVRWLIGELIAELNVGHAYIWGEWNGVRPVSTGYLGADLVQDGEGIRVEHVLRGEPGDPRRTSPLRAPGVDVKDGDWLVMIDGHELEPGENPHEWLVGTVGRPIRIGVTSGTEPVMAGAREYEVEPIWSDGELRYWDWVEANRKKVSDATGGRVGYVHVPNTSSKGYTEFVRGLYAQHRKDGLIIDVRYNRGGFIPEMFVEHLLRPHYNTWVPRDGMDWRTPSIAVHGPKVMLTNGYAGSGGDAFPYYFKQFELGKTVGTTTWGGLVGIDNNLSLLIGGGITAPSFGFVNKDGEWDVERTGVPADIEVIDPPEAFRLGEDPQLDSAIEQALEELKTYESPVPKRPATFPNRP